jgi:hypothetical protein
VWAEVDALFKPYLPPQMLDARTRGDSGPFTTDTGVEGLLTEAGFEQVRTATWELLTTFQDAEQWYAWAWSHGQRAMWEHVPEGERDQLKAQAFRLLASVSDDHGRIALKQGIRYTLGVR